MLATSEDDDHALSDFLRERLPQVGLDYDTYGPYVLPLLLSSSPSDADDEEENKEEWDSVMELLQASSESHSDDNDVWLTLRQDIQSEWKKLLERVHQLEEQEQAQRAQKMEEVLAEERRWAQQAALEAAEQEKAKQQPLSQNLTVGNSRCSGLGWLNLEREDVFSTPRSLD
ncbi:hypothetical protein ACA910_017393 [Epithemia clementina (nom. ined.)]